MKKLLSRENVSIVEQDTVIGGPKEQSVFPSTQDSLEKKFCKYKPLITFFMTRSTCNFTTKEYDFYFEGEKDHYKYVEKMKKMECLC